MVIDFEMGLLFFVVGLERDIDIDFFLLILKLLLVKLIREKMDGVLMIDIDLDLDEDVVF